MFVKFSQHFVALIKYIYKFPQNSRRFIFGWRNVSLESLRPYIRLSAWGGVGWQTRQLRKEAQRLTQGAMAKATGKVSCTLFPPFQVTLVCQVLARQIEFTAFNFYLFALSGFHRGCTLGTLLATCINWGNI